MVIKLRHDRSKCDNEKRRKTTAIDEKRRQSTARKNVLLPRLNRPIHMTFSKDYGRVSTPTLYLAGAKK